MGSPSKMRGGQGVVLACLVAASLGGWEDTGEECSGNTCFDPASKIIRVVRSKTSSTGLKYKERSNDKVSVVDMMAVCLPGVDKAFMASSFKSCEDKKLTSVCTMKERGWQEGRRLSGTALSCPRRWRSMSMSITTMTTPIT